MLRGGGTGVVNLAGLRSRQGVSWPSRRGRGTPLRASDPAGLPLVRRHHHGPRPAERLERLQQRVGAVGVVRAAAAFDVVQRSDGCDVAHACKGTRVSRRGTAAEARDVGNLRGFCCI